MASFMNKRLWSFCSGAAFGIALECRSGSSGTGES